MKKIYFLFFLVFITTATFSQAINLTVTTTAATCGQNNGSIIITLMGGTAPYTYNLNGFINQSSNVFTGLTPGNYTVTVTDAMGVSGTASAIINSNNNVFANAGLDSAICAGNSIQLIGSAPVGSTYQWSPTAGLNNPTIPNPVASPSASTTYILTIMNGGCPAYDTVVIMVMPPVQANAGNDLDVCLGSSVQLSGSGGITYSWSPAIGLNNPNIPNPVVINPAASIIYTLIVSNGICSASDNVTISVQSVAVPVIGLNNGLLTVSNPDPLAVYKWQILNGTNWDDIPAANGITYLPSSSADYRAAAIKGPCIEYSTSLLAGRPPSGNRFGIYLYPNPADNYLILDEIKLTEEWEVLEILNVQGIRILTQSIKDRSSVRIFIGSLGAGIYNIRLTKKDATTTTFRFVKK